MDEIYRDTDVRMVKCIDIFTQYINKIHTTRISPDLLNGIKIEYFNTFKPLRSISNILSEDSRTLAITVFDPILVPKIEKMIKLSDLDLNISSIGSVIRVSSPILTEERRHNIIKIIRKEAESTRIILRNIRRDANDRIRILLKNKIINKDSDHRFQVNIQKLTNLWINKIDNIVSKKELELLKL